MLVEKRRALMGASRHGLKPWGFTCPFTRGSNVGLKLRLANNKTHERTYGTK
jgi:hypothetical protein